ncbi:uncharacterized protein AB675_10933 [Cyphellophora attinorum]|uniref:Fungal N-terminal domain-containing protein n=1 Tax=Cyphellophora attinorum TaxID=1664694 RepID=A0A0N1H4B8_9EURO|nr:uncharacterized protein AB675_10933 [Phialophora attinorum]KPI35504.1 hypothetical protein AB675_10933 [Phialophora attinorum]
MSGVEIVGLAIGVAGIATDVAFSLSTFSRTVKSANKSINYLHREVSEVETVTHLISTTLGEEKLAKAASEKLKDAIKSALESCKDVLKEISIAMNPVSNKKDPPPAYAATERQPMAKPSFFRRLKFTLMEEEIMKMRDSLRSSIGMIGLLVQLLLSAAHIKEHPGQSLPVERLQGLAAYGKAKEKPEEEEKSPVKEKPVKEEKSAEGDKGWRSL